MILWLVMEASNPIFDFTENLLLDFCCFSKKKLEDYHEGKNLPAKY